MIYIYISLYYLQSSKALPSKLVGSYLHYIEHEKRALRTQRKSQFVTRRLLEKQIFSEVRKPHNIILFSSSPSWFYTSHHTPVTNWAKFRIFFNRCVVEFDP